MCARKQRLFFLLALFCLLSPLAFSQDGGSPLPVPDLSELSEASSSVEMLPELPAQPTPQIRPGMTLEQRQAATLKAWIEWYNLVEASWSKAKTSSEKRDKARLKQIESRDIEIAALKDQLRQAQAAAFIAGLGGMVTGLIVDRVISR